MGEDPDQLGPNLTSAIRNGEFLIGPGDQISVDIWRHEDLSRNYEVDPDGRLFCHLIGPLEVQGLSRAGVREKLTRAYDAYLVNPSIAITVTMSLDRKITVLGSVKTPGVYPLSTPRTTVLDMLGRAGGLAEGGDTTGIIIARLVDGEARLASFNLDLLFDPREDNPSMRIPWVHPGDYLYVLRTDSAVFDERMRAINEGLKGLVFAERAILLKPQVIDVF